MNIFKSVLEPYSSYLCAQLFFSSQNTSLNCLSKQLLPALPDHIPKLQLFLDSLLNDKLLREHLLNRMWSSAPSFSPFRAYCCPSGELINGFIMLWKRHPISLLLGLNSSYQLFIHAKCAQCPEITIKPCLLLDFPLTIHRTVEQNYVLQKHKDRRNPFNLYRKEAHGLKSW